MPIRLSEAVASGSHITLTKILDSQTSHYEIEDWRSLLHLSPVAEKLRQIVAIDLIKQSFFMHTLLLSKFCIELTCGQGPDTKRCPLIDGTMMANVARKAYKIIFFMMAMSELWIERTVVFNWSSRKLRNPVSRCEMNPTTTFPFQWAKVDCRTTDRLAYRTKQVKVITLCPPPPPP